MHRNTLFCFVFVSYKFLCDLLLNILIERFSWFIGETKHNFFYVALVQYSIEFLGSEGMIWMGLAMTLFHPIQNRTVMELETITTGLISSWKHRLSDQPDEISINNLCHWYLLSQVLLLMNTITIFIQLFPFSLSLLFFKIPFSSTEYNCSLSNYISIIFFYSYMLITLSQCSPLRFRQIKPWRTSQEVLNLSCLLFHCLLFSISFSLLYWLTLNRIKRKYPVPFFLCHKREVYCCMWCGGIVYVNFSM